MGFGKRSDFTVPNDPNQNPGPGHVNVHVLNTIARNNSFDPNCSMRKTNFPNNYDKYKSICYKGMEKSYYLTQSQGPGAYLGQDMHVQSYHKSTTQFSIPKKDRGLQFPEKSKLRTLPGPGNYKSEKSFERVVSKQGPRCTIGTSSRDVPFAKYGAQNSSLISKGIL